MCLLAAVPLLLFWKYFLLDQTLVAGDTAFVFLPFRHFVFSRLEEGALPLWNPHLFGGTPALAEAQYQLFYLPNQLLWLTGVTLGMGWLLPLHLAWMAAGTYRFTRRSLGQGRPGALVAALVFAFGGFMQSRMANSPYPEAAAWLPWILLAYDQARQRGGPWLLLPGALLALQLCAGATQFVFFTLVLLLAFHLYRLAEARTGGSAGPGRAWAALGMTLAGGVALAAVQLLPQAELALHSDRGLRASYEFATEFSLQPGHFLATLLFPRFWGLFDSRPASGFFPGEELAYLGVLPLGLLAAAAARTGAPERRAFRFWGLSALLSVLLALGRNNPLYPTLYEWVPGFAAFRAPARWLLLFTFAAAVLSGFGLDAILGDGSGARRAARAALLGFAGLAAAGAGLLLGPWGAGAFPGPGGPAGPGPAAGLLLLSAGLCGALATGRGREALAGRGPALAAGLLVVDLLVLSTGMEFQHTVDAGGLDAVPETVARLRQVGGVERFWAATTSGPLEQWQAPAPVPGVTPAVFRAKSALLAHSLMLSCLAAQHGGYGLTGVWGALMPLRRHARPLYNPQSDLEERRRWLRLLNVRYYLSILPLSGPEFQLEMPGIPNVYRDTGALPRAFVAPAALRLPAAQVLAALARPEFDPRRQVILEPLPGERVGASPGGAEPPSGSELVPATLQEYRPERVRLEVVAPRPGYAVLMDTPYPGWRASVGGLPAEIRPANWVGRAVPVPAGRHQVAMRFEPATFRVGLFITLVSLAGVLAAGLACLPRGAGKRKRCDGLPAAARKHA